jgi:hypothetical protein
MASVVVGGVRTTLLLPRCLMPVLSSFHSHREPPQAAASTAHDFEPAGAPGL